MILYFELNSSVLNLKETQDGIQASLEPSGIRGILIVPFEKFAVSHLYAFITRFICFTIYQIQ